MRFLDLSAALLGLLLLAPVLFLVAVLVKATSSGPVLHRAVRVGRNGTLFELLKFRTMVVGSENGDRLTRHNDPRVTRVGRLLRRTKIDELPQLFNVVRGEMSLVGPRPEDARYVSHYSPDQRRILEVRPGITSVASIHFRTEENLLCGDDWETRYLREIMPAKVKLELSYLERRSVVSDVQVVARTLGVLVGLRKPKEEGGTQCLSL